MVKMRLKEINENLVTYYFQPEFKGKEGIIEFIFDHEKLVDYLIIEESEYRCTNMYIGHCLSLANKMKKEGKFKDVCSAQWY